MATVMGPSQPQHAGKFRSKSTRPSSTTPSSSARSFDPFYGHEELAGLCARYVTHLFQCPVMPPNNSNPQHKLPYFIAYALNRTKLHTSVAYSALVLLSRLKARFPSAKGSSGHRLFISAFMISSKVMCDDTYSNKSWAIVAQNLFALREVNQMEHEMVNYLDFELNVDSYTLSVFEAALKRDFGANASQPYPRYPLDMISKRARESRSPSAPPSRAGLSIDTVCASPSSVQSPIEEPAPPTPDATYSNSTSPATTPSPETPLGYVNMDVTVEADDYDLCIRPTCKPSKSQFSQARPAIW